MDLSVKDAPRRVVSRWAPPYMLHMGHQAI